MDKKDKQSDCDSDEHGEHSIGYRVVEDNEKLGENSFDYAKRITNWQKLLK